MVSESDKLSVLYHDIFDYPLTKDELKKWKVGKRLNKNQPKKVEIQSRQGYFFVRNKKYLVKRRKERERYSKKKLRIAKRAAEDISQISSVLFVGVTGALAMNNAQKSSDIDLLIITKEKRLWTSRLSVYLYLKLKGYKLRKPGVKNEKDMLCLNMWLDESALVWPVNDRNIYTAHEIAQIVPVVNKDKAHEKLLESNRWIKKYWPNSIKNKKNRSGKYKNLKDKDSTILLSDILERFLYLFQKVYMKNKITREIVSLNKAIFHPVNWGKKVLLNLDR